MVAVALRPVCILPATRVAVDPARGCASIVVPAGAYAGTVAWPSRALFLAALDIAVRGPWRSRLRRTPRDSTTPDTFMRWARREAAGADSSTGRGMRESVDTIAADLGCSRALVQRCRRIGRDLGVYRDVVAGRLLRLSERLEVHAMGSRQRGVTGERVWSVPPSLRPILASLTARRGCRHVDYATQPARGSVQEKRSSRKGDLVRRGRKVADVVGPGSEKRESRRRLAAGERLAREVCARLPYRHRLRPRRLAAHFAEFERRGWSARAVLDAADAVLRALGWRSPSSAGGGYLVWLLRHVDAAAVEPVPERPAWCGACDERSRLVEVVGDRVARCSACHPLRVTGNPVTLEV